MLKCHYCYRDLKTVQGCTSPNSAKICANYVVQGGTRRTAQIRYEYPKDKRGGLPTFEDWKKGGPCL